MQTAVVSKRNLIWLVAVIATGLVAWLLAGWLAGIVAAGVVLAISEIVERRARRQRIAARTDDVPREASRGA